MVECGEEPEIDDEEFDKEDSVNKRITLKTVLAESRHLEKIEPYHVEAHCWRLKDRMKTVSVALVLCLNIPVDPPDVVKLQPCARLEAWIDPQGMPPPKAIEIIGSNLQKAYERWQPKARYKFAPDPTVDDIKKLCMSLRRNAKEERVLFHYNGHGVPRPTDNGEIWVFNANYTQYIPFYIYDLQQWMGTPSIYVYDCSHAGKIVKLFRSFSKNHDDGKCIHLAACGEKQMLPMNPDLPADLFTACLTTPVKMAIKYYLLQHKKRFLPELTFEMLDKIPGQINDRRSMLGELNWIFTAITDTIAWNTLPRDLFQKLFRQDLLVASLFRNFLLAQRIMRSYNCTPVSSPILPPTCQNHMWGAWDLALELSLAQLPRLLSLGDPSSEYLPSPFFEEQLTAFQVWLNLGSMQRSPPEQLPIVLQVLLSQVYRPRALELLGSFIGLGPWAVNLVLEVGIFPYILKLLQSTAKELRPLLTLLWAKILAVDPQCKADLVRENGNKYFTNVLKDVLLPVECRTLAAFVMCSLVSDCTEGVSAALQGHILPLCLELIMDEHPPLRQWATICAARTWNQHPKARWEATRDNAPDKLLALLDDPVPEVRASAVYALGTFIKSLPIKDRSDQGRLINHKIAVSLKNKVTEEASPLVRVEMLVALHYIVLIYETSFKEVAKQYYQEAPDCLSGSISPFLNKYSQDVKNYGPMSTSASLGRSTKQKGTSHNQFVGTSPVSYAAEPNVMNPSIGMRKTASYQSLYTLGGVSSLSHEHMYLKVWQSVVAMEKDPYPTVAKLAKKVTIYLKNKIMATSQDTLETKGEPGTPGSRSSQVSEDGSAKIATPRRRNSTPQQNPHLEEVDEFITPVITTKFVEWCSNYFMKSEVTLGNDWDSVILGPFEKSPTTQQLPQPEEKWTLGIQKLEDQKFIIRNPETPEVLMFHPNDPLLVIGNKNHVAVWDIENDSRVSYWNNTNSGNSHISSLTTINPVTPSCYLCVGSSDGFVRVWKDIFRVDDNRHQFSPRTRTFSHRDNFKDLAEVDEEPPFLITAFNALEEITSFKKESDLLMSWEQDSATLVVGGDSDKIRLWDLAAEKKIKDIVTKGSITTALHSLGPWIAAGFSDGYLRLFDRRISNSLVREWKDHPNLIITTQIFNSSSTAAHVISGSCSGEVRLYDLRRNGSVQVCQPGHKIQCMGCHPKAHLFAVGTQAQQISVYHTSGSYVNSIRYYNGIMGQKLGPVNCLCFHPTQVLLAAATKEGTVTVHGLTKR